MAAGRVRIRSRIRSCGPGRRGAGAILAGLLLGLPLSGAAQSPGQADPAAAPVGLDALLKLPDRTPTPEARPSVGGATREEWELRFAKARLAREEAQLRLRTAQTELEELAAGTSTWQVAAPGGGATSETGPLSYSLREEIRRSREDIARAERSLDELRVEANLAGVPPEWIADDAAEGPSTDAPDGSFQETTP